MTPRVFLSHKNEDSPTASIIALRLKTGGLDVYLDVIDGHLKESGPDLADYLRAQLARCTQLLAVISDKTTLSWWVPWEIGVATEKERFLASFVAGGAAVPEYLEKWPYLRTMADVDEYVRQSKNAQSLFESRSRSTDTASARTSSFRQFHTSLRAALGQR